MTSTTWTYDPSLLSSNGTQGTLMQVRRLFGDVLANDAQLQDTEVLWAISQYSNIYLAAAECARDIALQYSRKVDTVTGEIRTMYSSQAGRYAAMAAQLEARGMSRGGVLPYAGAMSAQDKMNVENDSDRVAPQFNIGMDDNLLPESPVGNETPGTPTGGNQP